tara:strand:- start:621 stop:1583 length:963 start_codon:yes stop_codon:yes gene_type:complete
MAGETTPTTTTIPNSSPDPISRESSLSNWAGDYVTGLLGKGQALTNMPYQGYEGELSAGVNKNQENAFAGIAGLTLPNGGYTANNNMFDQAAAEQYMNPYIASVLNPQLAEMNRQNQIQQVNDNAAFTKAGAYGGGRQAIMNSERNDNNARLMNQATQEGYSNAYNSAFDMFTSDQTRMDKSNQFAANYGLEELGAETDMYQRQLEAGEMERGITSQGLAADQAQFNEEREYPYKQIQWGMGLLNGMPLETQNTNYSQDSAVSNYVQNAGGGSSLLGDIFDLFRGGGNSNDSGIVGNGSGGIDTFSTGGENPGDPGYIEF